MTGRLGTIARPGQRPSISAPLALQSRLARAAQRERWARQPRLGALGLLLVLPVALLLALAAGGSTVEPAEEGLRRA